MQGSPVPLAIGIAHREIQRIHAGRPIQQARGDPIMLHQGQSLPVVADRISINHAPKSANILISAAEHVCPCCEAGTAAAHAVRRATIPSASVGAGSLSARVPNLDKIHRTTYHTLAQGRLTVGRQVVGTEILVQIQAPYQTVKLHGFCVVSHFKPLEDRTRTGSLENRCSPP